MEVCELAATEPCARPVAVLSNTRVNAPVCPVTPLADGASVAPVHPARYALR